MLTDAGQPADGRGVDRPNSQQKRKRSRIHHSKQHLAADARRLPSPRAARTLACSTARQSAADCSMRAEISEQHEPSYSL